MTRRAENDELLSPAGVLLPLEVYEVGDEAESEFCSDCRNCCSTSSAELVLLALLVPSVEDEASVGGGPPWPP